MDIDLINILKEASPFQPVSKEEASSRTAIKLQALRVKHSRLIDDILEVPSLIDLCRRWTKGVKKTNPKALADFNLEVPDEVVLATVVNLDLIHSSLYFNNFRRAVLRELRFLEPHEGTIVR